MNYKKINPVDYPGWDDLLLTHDKSTFFHTSAWAEVLSETYGYKPLYFTLFKNNKLSSLFPVMEIDSFFTGKRGVSLPFSDECHPLVRNKDQLKEFTKFITKFGKNAGWKYIELRGGQNYINDHPIFISHYMHILYLNKTYNKIFSSFKKSVKRNIKKAKKQNVKITISGSWISVKKFYQLHCATRRYHGLPPQPLNFFKNIFKRIISSNKGFVVLAFWEENIIAGAVYFHFGKRAIYKYGASDKRFLKLRPNNLIMSEAIKWYCHNGYEVFSFGRTAPENLGLLQFKRGWNTKEEKLHYYKYDFSKKCFLKNRKKTETSYGLFKIMPISLLRLAGNLLYRHVG